MLGRCAELLAVDQIRHNGRVVRAVRGIVKKRLAVSRLAVVVALAIRDPEAADEYDQDDE